jgi:hypothetical protein
MPDLMKVLAAVAIAVVLFVMTGCGRQVDLDPRDAEALAAYEEEYGCDRNSPMVELKIHNRSSASFDVWLFGRAGAKRRIGNIGGFDKRLKQVSRYELELGSTFVIRQSSGLTIGSGEYHVPVGLLSCDVGYLELGPNLNMSHYIGMDFYPNEEFKR